MKKNYVMTPKKLLFSVFCLLTLGACSGNQANNAAGNTQNTAPSNNQTMVFEKETHDFGQIKSGERVSYLFRFTNKGNEPLVISRIDTGCGCTAGDYPKEPVLPGEKGSITVFFNSSGRIGQQSQSARVFTNIASEPIVLRIKATVVEPNN